VLGAALALLALGVLSAGAYVYSTTARPPSLDRASLCPADGPRSATVVLLDSTDDIPDIAKREVRTILVDMAEALPTYGLIEIRLLDPNLAGGRSIFAKCNPGDGSGLSEYTANPVMARKRWLDGFREPLDAALQTGLHPLPGKASPIMQTVQRIAVERFTGRASTEIPKSLVIISDMREHEADYSQYTGDLSYGRYKGSRAYRKFQTDLHGADVTIYYVQRLSAKPINTVDHIRFWADWIRDNNGRLKQATKLQGVG
jgi:hypothetical protein